MQLSTTSPKASPSQPAVNPPAFTATAGVIPNTDELTPVDYFRLFFDERVIELIFTETRRYAQQYLAKNRQHLDSHPHARAHKWTKVTLSRKEIEAFLALLIAMGICGFPTLMYSNAYKK